jgi:hypothetical protein
LLGEGLLSKAAAYDMVGFRWWTSNPADNLLFTSSLSVSSANGGNDYGTPGTVNWGSLVTYFTNTPTIAQVGFSPVAGAYGGTQSVALSGGPTGDYICYTTNGSTPVPNTSGGCNTGTLYTSAVSVSSNETLNAIGAKSGYNNSPLTTAAYTISSFGTIYLNTTFNEATSGALTGTTPATCTNGCTGTWLASNYGGGTNAWSYLNPGAGSTGTGYNSAPSYINIGQTNYTMRVTPKTGNTGGGQQIYVRYTPNSLNFVVVQVDSAATGGAGIAIADITSGTGTTLGTPSTVNCGTNQITIVVNGTSITASCNGASTGGTLPGGSANTTATYAGMVVSVSGETWSLAHMEVSSN